MPKPTNALLTIGATIAAAAVAVAVDRRRTDEAIKRGDMLGEGGAIDARDSEPVRRFDPIGRLAKAADMILPPPPVHLGRRAGLHAVGTGRQPQGDQRVAA